MVNGSELALLKKAKDEAHTANVAAHEAMRAHHKMVSLIKDEVRQKNQDLRAAREVYEASKQSLRKIMAYREDIYAQYREVELRLHPSKGAALKSNHLSDAPEIKQLSAHLTTIRAKIKEVEEQLHDAKLKLRAVGVAYEKATSTKAALRAHYDQRVASCKQTGHAYTIAMAAYQRALSVVRAECKVIATLAGIPEHYLDSIRGVLKPNNMVHIYFGGIDGPIGEGHGHYIISQLGNIVYRRDPFVGHGKQNQVA